jgi:hypothetical protein
MKLLRFLFLICTMHSFGVDGKTNDDNFTLSKLKKDYQECYLNKDKNDCEKISFQIKNELKSNFVISNFFDLNIDYQDVISKCEKVKSEKSLLNGINFSYACITGNYENVGRFYFRSSGLGVIYLREIVVETCFDGDFNKIYEALIKKFDSKDISTSDGKGRKRGNSYFEMKVANSEDRLKVSSDSVGARVSWELSKEMRKKYTLVCPGDYKINFILSNQVNPSDLLKYFNKEILKSEAKSNKPNF